MQILAVDPQSFWVSSAFGGIAGAVIAAIIGIPLSWWLKRTSDMSLETQKAVLSSANAKQLEQLKNSLKIEADAEMERLRAKLRLDAFVHETRFQKLHEKRAEVIAETYHRLHDLKSALILAVAPHVEPSLKEQKHFDETNDIFYQYASSHDIYFSRDIAALITDLVKQCFIVRTMHGKNVAQSGDTLIDKWLAAMKEIDNRIEPVEEKLRSEFRKLIGVEEK